MSALRDLGRALDRPSLLVARPETDSAWAWFGGRRPLEPALLADSLASWPATVPLALGEPADDLAGWRQTHRQARAALSVASRGATSVTRYADVALFASALKDDLLADSLRDIFLAPLELDRDGGEALRQTLRAYFSAERNVSSAAVTLGINRHTVTSRLRTIEERIGRPLGRCAAEVEAALWLDERGSEPAGLGTE
jgi:DNA-binding PucR family transcriptional regulator